MAVANQPPVRNTSGATTDFPYGPLGDSGQGNPFFYHSFSDDFDNSLGATGLYTVSHTTTGTVVHTAGDGGLATFATAAASNDAVSIQLPAASFTCPQGALAGKKAFFLCRFNLSDVSACSFVAGWCQTTATPLTTITDGIWFSKASGGTVINLNSAISSTVTTVAVPTAAYTLTNGVNIDMGWYVDRFGAINGFIGSQLVGFIPQSGSGTGGSIGAGTPVRGRVMSFTPANLPTAALNPTLGIAAGAVAIKNLVADFWCSQKER